MEGFIAGVLDFIGSHPGWVFLAMFIASFGESLVFVSLVFPGTALLLAAGTMVPSGRLSIWPLLIGAVLGAVLGDGVSYALGRHFGRRIEGLWPFRRRPELVAGGVAYFKRHGGKSVFIGRFFGPLRAVVPLAAGILRMKPRDFWLANMVSALIWAPAVLLPSALVGETVGRFVGGERMLPIAVLILIVLGIAGLWGPLSRARRQQDR